MKRLVRGLTIALPVAFLVGCGDAINDTNDAEDAVVTADVAAAMAETTGDDVGLMTTQVDEATKPGLGQGNCTRTGFQFRCPGRRFDDLMISRDVTFFDENGDPQDAYDDQTTASINIVSTLEGSRDRGQVSVVVTRNRDMTVGGMSGTETQRVWNGSGSSSDNRVRRTDGGDDRTYDMSASTVIDEVVVPVPRTDGWPLSGTITREVTVEVVLGLEDTRTRHRTVVITFNGTQFVPMTVNGVEFTLDLATRTVVEADA